MKALELPCLDCGAPIGTSCLNNAGMSGGPTHTSRSRRAHYLTLAERGDRKHIRTVGEIVGGGDLIGVIREAIRPLLIEHPDLTETIAQAAARAASSIPVKESTS